MPRPAPPEIALEVHPDVMLDRAALAHAAARQAGVDPGRVRAVEIVRRSIDARRRQPRLNLRVRVWCDEPPPPRRPEPADLPALHGEPTVAIVGAGPAGMFCAWALARAGIRSVVLERGRTVRARRIDLARLGQRGDLDPESNYCFGEGGAGTFSDGKLYTRSTKRGPVREVLEALVGWGAPGDILVDARPHIGTNRLPAVIGAMRAQLESAGVVFRFEARVDGLRVRNGAAAGVVLADGEVVEARRIVACPGHSAPDAIGWLAQAGARIVAKPFAVGVRIEHAQAFVDRIQLGELSGHPALGAASYRLVEAVGDTSVYSFCMCPGGHIVPAATRPGRQVVNGMSPARRRGRFANAGLVTPVGPAELAAAGLDPADPLAGMALQERLEARAFEIGGGAFVAPAQTLADLVAGRASTILPACSYHRGIASARLDGMLGTLAMPLRAALERIGARMPGFVSHEALAVGLESRTSSACRVERDPDTLVAHGLGNLHPCGEGAGYAGGIVSAALDGIRVAEAIAHRR